MLPLLAAAAIPAVAGAGSNMIGSLANAIAAPLTESIRARTQITLEAMRDSSQASLEAIRGGRQLAAATLMSCLSERNTPTALWR